MAASVVARPKCRSVIRILPVGPSSSFGAITALDDVQMTVYAKAWYGGSDGQGSRKIGGNDLGVLTLLREAGAIAGPRISNAPRRKA